MGRIAPANEATALHVPSSPPPEWLILLVQAHQLDGGPAVRSQARQALWKQLRPWYYFGNVLLVFSIIGLILWLFRRRIWSKTPFQSTSCAPISPTDVLGVIGIWVLFRLTWSIFVPVLSKNHPTATLIVEYLPQVLVGFAAINYLLLRCGCSWSALGVTPPGNKKTITKWGLWGCCGIAMALPLVFTVQWLNQFVVNMTDPVFPIVLGIMEEGHLFWLIVITTIVAPIFEEIMFRGLLYGSLRTLYSARTANIIQAFGFALLHFSPSTFLPLWVLGLVLGRLREQFSDLAPAIITHALWNGLVLMVFHFYLRV
jgi:membrane protease YdiL (CAAX protease family)